MKTKAEQRAEQRIEIAKDVLKWIRTGMIVAITSNAYFRPLTNNKYNGKQLKDVLPKIKKCEVCAKGAMFYAHVMRHNDLVIPESGVANMNYYGEECLNLTMFTETMLGKIEDAFEDGEYTEKHNLETDENTLKHIMNNIIKNKGTFKP